MDIDIIRKDKLVTEVESESYVVTVSTFEHANYTSKYYWESGHLPLVHEWEKKNGFDKKWDKYDLGTLDTSKNKYAKWEDTQLPMKVYEDLRKELLFFEPNSIVLYKTIDRLYCGVNREATCFGFLATLLGEYIESYALDNKPPYDNNPPSIKWGYRTYSNFLSELPYNFKSIKIPKSKSAYTLASLLNHFELEASSFVSLSLSTYYPIEADSENLRFIYFKRI